MMEKIILSAIMTGENQCCVGLHPESRHHFIIHHLAKSGFKTPIKGEQGFLTSEGRFVDRLEALHIAKSAGQIEEAEFNILYSEDVFGDGKDTTFFQAE